MQSNTNIYLHDIDVSDQDPLKPERSILESKTRGSEIEHWTIIYRNTN